MYHIGRNQHNIVKQLSFNWKETNFKTEIKEKKSDPLNRFRKSIWENLTPLHDKNTNKLGIEGQFVNLMKGIYETPTANIIFNNERLQEFLLIL